MVRNGFDVCVLPLSDPVTGVTQSVVYEPCRIKNAVGGMEPTYNIFYFIKPITKSQPAVLCTVCGGKQPVDLLLLAARQLHGQPQLLIEAGDREAGGGLGGRGQVLLSQRAVGGRGHSCQVHR